MIRHNDWSEVSEYQPNIQTTASESLKDNCCLQTDQRQPFLNNKYGNYHEHAPHKSSVSAYSLSDLFGNSLLYNRCLTENRFLCEENKHGCYLSERRLHIGPFSR